MRKSKHPATPQVCPVCYEDVPPQALACPECGADHRSGWNEEAASCDGLDLPETWKATGPYLNSPRQPPARHASLSFVWWITAVVLLGWLLWMYGISPLL